MATKRNAAEIHTMMSSKEAGGSKILRLLLAPLAVNSCVHKWQGADKARSIGYAKGCVTTAQTSAWLMPLKPQQG
jgi:hypothetical protein